ncbi:Tudor domain-containing protein 1 [Trichoplax sp. H2]|nr:Tudor domain-containing protein 1 [Trichoplax sp. H2]|eukprot:RDD42368.1 Tudor domain-containing protein 1 [Trichoplax sp. H2]
MSKPRANFATMFAGQIQQNPVEITIQFEKMPSHHFMNSLTEFLPQFGLIVDGPIINYSRTPTVRVSFKLRDDAFRCKRALDKISEMVIDDEMSTKFSISNAQIHDMSILETMYKLSTFANTQDTAEKFMLQIERAFNPDHTGTDMNSEMTDTDTEKSIYSVDTTSNHDSDSSTAFKEYNLCKVTIRIRYLPNEITKKQFSDQLEKITTTKFDTKFESAKYPSFGRIGQLPSSLITFESEEEAFKITQILSNHKINDKTIDVQFIDKRKRTLYLKKAFAEYQLRNEISEKNKNVFQELFTILKKKSQTLDKDLKASTNTRVICISRIPRSVDQERIKEIFENFGKIKILGGREYSRKGNWHMTLVYVSDESTFAAIAAMNRYKLEGQKLDVTLDLISPQSQKDALKEWMIDFKLAFNHPYKILMTTTDFQKNLKKIRRVLAHRKFGQASVKNDCDIQFCYSNTIISKQVLLVAIDKVGLVINEWSEQKDQQDDGKITLFIKFSSEIDGLVSYHAANLMPSNVLFTSCSWSTRSETEKNKRLEKLHRVFEKFLSRFASEMSLSNSSAKNFTNNVQVDEMESDTNTRNDTSWRSSVLINASSKSIDARRDLNNTPLNKDAKQVDSQINGKLTSEDITDSITRSLRSSSINDGYPDSSSYESSTSDVRKIDHRKTSSKHRSMERSTVDAHQTSDTNNSLFSNDEAPSNKARHSPKKKIALSRATTGNNNKSVDPHVHDNLSYNDFNYPTINSSNKDSMVLPLAATWCNDGCSFWGKISSEAFKLGDIVGSIYPSKCWVKINSNEVKVGRIYGVVTNKLHRVRVLALDTVTTVAFIDSGGSIQNVNLNSLYKLPEYLHYTQSGPYPFKLYGTDTLDGSARIEGKRHLAALLDTASHLYAVVIDEKFSNQIEVIIFLPDNLQESLNEQVSRSRYAFLNVENSEFLRNILMAKDKVKEFTMLQLDITDNQLQSIRSTSEQLSNTQSPLSVASGHPNLKETVPSMDKNIIETEDHNISTRGQNTASTNVPILSNRNNNLEEASTDTDNECIDSLSYEELVVSATIDIAITDVVNPNYFLVKSLEPDREIQQYSDIRDLMDKRYSKNVRSVNINELSCGKAYSAFFAEHWRRVIIDTIGNENAEIHCVDEGIVQTIDLNEIKPLFKSVAQSYASIYPCTLYGITNPDNCESWVPDIVDWFKGLVLNVNVLLKAKIILRDEYNYHIDLFVNNENGLTNINRILVEKNLCKLNWDSHRFLCKIHSFHRMIKESLLPINQANLLSSENLIKVEVTNIINPGLFWLHCCDETGQMNKHYLENMKVAMQTVGHKRISVGKIYFIGTQSSGWYRGLIMRLLPNKQAAVLNIDYGTTDCISLADIGANYNESDPVPPLAMQCSLHKCIGTLQDGEWNTESISSFRNLVTLGNLKARFISISNDGTYDVQLQVTKESSLIKIENTLIMRGYAKRINDTKDTDGDLNPLQDSLAALRHYSSYVKK